MPHCTKCGAVVAETAAYCPNCGQAQRPVAPAGTQSGLSENASAALSYSLGWLTGLMFFLIDSRPYVRYHAAQSIVVFGALHILHTVLAMAFGIGWFLGGMVGWTGFGLGMGLINPVNLMTLVLWVVCMVKAHQGERFKVPFAGDLAESFAAR